jgi:hypothetical protein
LDDLTNYVDAITNYVQQYNNSSGTPVPVGRPATYGYSPSPVADQQFRLINGYRIIGLLSTPRYIPPWPATGIFYSNYVVANVRALSGGAVDKYPQKNQTILGSAFNYRLIVAVVPYDTPDTNAVPQALTRNLYDLQLTFRWPLLPNGNTGFGRQTFRTLVSGQLTSTNDATVNNTLYFLEPGSYARSP